MSRGDQEMERNQPYFHWQLNELGCPKGHLLWSKTGIPVISGIHLPPSIAAVLERYPGRYSQSTRSGAIRGSSQGSESDGMALAVKFGG